MLLNTQVGSPCPAYKQLGQNMVVATPLQEYNGYNKINVINQIETQTISTRRRTR